MRPRHLLVLAVAFAISAQEQPRVQTQVYVTAIDVVVDVRDKAGNLPAGLKPSDFVVVEDGIERTVVGTQYLRRSAPAATATATAEGATPAPAAAVDPKTDWQTVLYFETELSSGESRRAIAQELMKQADHLASIGAVDVVLADPTPHALLRDSRDAEAIRTALKTVMGTVGANRLALERRRFVEEAEAQSSLAALRAQSGNVAAAAPSMDLGTKNTTSVGTGVDTSAAAPAKVSLTTIRPYLQQEVALISRFRNNLLGWLGSYRRHTPRTLLLSSDGFDINPYEFYRGYLFAGASDASIDELVKLSDSVTKTGELLAAAGWTTNSIPGDNAAGYGGIDDASTSGIGRMSRGMTMGRSEGPGKNQALYQSREPLQKFADATGGSVVANSGKIAAMVGSIDDRILLTFQVDRKPDGKPRKLQVKMRDANLKVRSAQWASSATPDELSQARAIKLLDADSVNADFPVEATVEWNAPGANKSGVLRVVAKLGAVRAFLPAGKATFRVTMSVKTASKTFAVNSVLPDYDISSGIFQFRAPVNIPADAIGMAFVIEELSSGLSGTARVVVP